VAPPILVLGYGSLMSAKGLGPQAPAVLDMWPARLAAWRTFDKPADTGFIAMDLVAPRRATLHARRATSADTREVDQTLEVAAGTTTTPALRPDSGRAIGAALVLFDAAGTTALAKREGYCTGNWDRLVAAAGERGLGAFLLDLARTNADDPLGYRRALAEVAGPAELDCFHYLPHPVETDGDPAVAFIAPEPGRTGDPRVDSVKLRWPSSYPVRLHELHRAGTRILEGGYDAERQHGYVEKCCLAMAHGIDVSDLFAGPLCPNDRSSSLLAGWRSDPTAWREEQAALRAVVRTVASVEAYRKRFPAAPAV